MNQKHWYHGPVQINQPIVGLEKTKEPEEEIDVEEEEEICKKQRVVIAKRPEL